MSAGAGMCAWPVPPTMQVSAIRSTPSTARGRRWRLTIDQPGGRADGAGLAEFQLDGRAQANHIAVAKHGLVGHGFAIDERGVVGLEHVALAAANQGRVVAREIAHQGDVGWAVRSSPTQDDPVIQADQIASHGIDPEQESALGAGRLGSGQRPGRGRVAGRNRAGAGW